MFLLINVKGGNVRYYLLITALIVSYAANSADMNFSYIFPEHQKREFSGVAIVAKGNDIDFSYVNTFVAKGRDSDDKVNLHSEFLIGSLSKQITAAIVLRLVDQGKIVLDKPVGVYLPDLKPEWKNKVTVRNLLNHTSGIVALEKPLESDPGNKFKYNNLNYNILGEIASRLTHKSYPQLAQEVFNFCGMKESYPGTEFMPKGIQPVGYAEVSFGSYKKIDQPISFESLPSAGVVSTAPDLVHWTQCLHKDNLISKKMHQEMVKSAATRMHRWGGLGYGFAMQLYQKNSVIEWSHSGYVSGFISTLSYYPKQDITMIVLENTSWKPDDMNRVFYYHDKLRQMFVEGETSKSE